MPIPDEQLGAALRRLLTRHGLALLAPDDHAGTGYAWYGTDDPSDIVDEYATLNDLLVYALREIGIPPGELLADTPDPVDLGFARLSQGIEMVAAALHCAPDVSIPQALIIVAGMEMQQPEDLHDPGIHSEAVEALHALVERGMLLLADNDGILIPSRLRDTLIHALETAGMPLLTWLVARYTAPGDTLADPMAGTGSLLLAATLQRNVILREVEPRWLDICQRNAASIRDRAGMFAGTIQVGQHDAREPWGYTCDHIIVSPPYGNKISARQTTRNRATTLQRLVRQRDTFVSDRWRSLLRQQEMSGALGAEYFHYGESSAQIGHLRGAAYWQAMTPIYRYARVALRPGGFLIVVIKDHIANRQRVCTADATVQVCEAIGFRLLERHQRALGSLSLWQRRRKERGEPVVEEEDILVLQ
jgi:methylase of polypeptide subunit release factors